MTRSNLTEPIIEVEGLTKRFPVKKRRRGEAESFVHAVEDVSFELQPGEALGLVGESGCGKSTTAKLIVGTHQPTAGTVLYRGTEISGLSDRSWFPLRRKIQMIFQDPFASLDPRQTVGSILMEPLIIHGMGDRRERKLRAMALLDVVGMNPRHIYRYPHEFSGGQRQRIGIARALALEPEVLVCDEPVSALDVSIQAQIINLLAELQERFGLSYLFIAHDLAVVRHLCDRVAVMYLGRIVETASRESLFENPRHPYTRALLSAVPVPDPALERSRARIVLPGDVPSPVSPPPGCAFHPRCSERSRVPDGRCEKELPLLDPLQEGACACHLADVPAAGGRA